MHLNNYIEIDKQLQMKRQHEKGEGHIFFHLMDENTRSIDHENIVP